MPPSANGRPSIISQAQDAWGAAISLHLEMRGKATLKDLDEYLRAIWLECCGHWLLQDRRRQVRQHGQSLGRERRPLDERGEGEQHLQPGLELSQSMISARPRS
ncbi:hypothetical protein [Candidatus Amarolinea dominans]|uniref:hypothetical protein n=1 Tax=Candidatus Amarolinea dominans TaxID=3140696 RepID=UPI001E1A0C26|nr:hypothetical protein [Anaerolineae bacterium]